MADEFGRRFAETLARKDFAGVTELLDPQVDFRAMTPNRFWEATGPEAIVDDVLTVWLTEDEDVEEVLAIEPGEVADRGSVRYRFLVRREDGLTVMEQQMYYETDGERITWMRVLCSGNRPVGG